MPKRHIVQEVLVSAQTMASSFDSNPILIEDYKMMVMTVSWAGVDNSSSTVAIQVSADGTNFNYRPNATAIPLLTTESSQIIEYRLNGPYKYLRLAFDHGTASAGLITVHYRLLNDRD